MFSVCVDVTSSRSLKSIDMPRILFLSADILIVKISLRFTANVLC